MSRVASAPTSRSAGQSEGIPHEKIAMRAYEKWCLRGRQHGMDVQDWVEAEKELRTEMTRSASSRR